MSAAQSKESVARPHGFASLRSWLVTGLLAVATAGAGLAHHEPGIRHDIPPRPIGLEDLKVLNGPVSDFPDMRLPSPEELGTLSRQRTTAVELTPGPDGRLTWQGEVLADPDAPFSLLVIRPEHSSWAVELQDPSGRWFSSQELAEPGADWKALHEELGLRAFDEGFEVIRMSSAGAGEWTVQIDGGPADRPTSKAAGSRGALIVESSGPLQLRSRQADWRAVVGRSMTVGIDLVDDDGTAAPADLVEIRSTLVSPTGERASLEVDGDGRVSFVPESPGLHRVEFDVVARTPTGAKIARSLQHAIGVVEAPMTLEAGKTVAGVSLRQDTRFKRARHPRVRIDLPMRLQGSKAGYLPQGDLPRAQIWAELWGRNSLGDETPVAWVGGMVLPEIVDDTPVIPFSIDQRWFQLAGTDGPYELRNLRVQDPDTSTPYLQLAHLTVVEEAPQSWSALKIADLPIDDEMRNGPRPAFLTDTELPQKHHEPIETLALVHGYCSGNVWGQFRDHFLPNPIRVPLDRFAARTNDAFARFIRDNMVGVNRFSTIGHSQGGMAALHLLAFFNTGLDASQAGRPLQSVGTPYLGAMIMDYQIILEGILGVDFNGCDPVINLTRIGAPIWLAGIPNSARRDVFYYRTRGGNFAPCHLAATPVIPGNDDGLIAVDEGALPGGYSLGVKTKQCHTDNMRHRFQLNDHWRNLNMAYYGRTFEPHPVTACFSTSLSSANAPTVLTMDGSCTTIREGSSPTYRYDVYNYTTGQTMTYHGKVRQAALSSAAIYRVTQTVSVSSPNFTDSYVTSVTVYGGNCLAAGETSEKALPPCP